MLAIQRTGLVARVAILGGLMLVTAACSQAQTSSEDRSPAPGAPVSPTASFEAAPTELPARVEQTVPPTVIPTAGALEASEGVTGDPEDGTTDMDVGRTEPAVTEAQAPPTEEPFVPSDRTGFTPTSADTVMLASGDLQFVEFFAFW